MKPFSVKSLLLAFVVATAMCARAIKRKSLSKAGALAAFVVGFLSIATGFRGMILLIFYQIGSTATKYKQSTKERIDAAAADSSVRGVSQVLACSAIAVILSVFHALRFGEDGAIDFVNAPISSALACGVVAHYAACLGDTLASELGILSHQTPILVTMPWLRVPPGTNGGVTIMGCVWSAIGGALIGMSTVAMDVITGISPLNFFQMIFFGAVCGLVGSFIDSLLGATLQTSYWEPETKMVYHHPAKWSVSAQHVAGIDLLNNFQVNLVSVAITTVFGGWVLAPLVFQRG